jgi:hypothetical protein
VNKPEKSGEYLVKTKLGLVKIYWRWQKPLPTPTVLGYSFSIFPGGF